MTSTPSMSTDEIARALQRHEVQMLIKFILAHHLQLDDYDTIQSVLRALPDIPNKLKMALFYLEDAQWSLRDALFHIELDTTDRENSWVMVENDGRPGGNQHYNLEIDRDLMKPGEKFNQDLLTITYRTIFNNHNTLTFPHKCLQDMDITDRDAIDDINRWRRSNIWHLVGPETGLSYSYGEKWHPLQETFVRNRFAFSDSAMPDYKSIHQDYIEIFDGVLLPGRSAKCGPRSQTGISSYFHRHVFNSPDSFVLARALTSDVKHDMARHRLRQDWQRRVDEATKALNKR